MKVNRSMKPRKGKTMSKADGYVCICDRNTTDIRLRVVSHPGLGRQDARSGGQMEQEKSVRSDHPNRRETSAQGEGVPLAADQIVVGKNGL